MNSRRIGGIAISPAGVALVVGTPNSLGEVRAFQLSPKFPETFGLKASDGAVLESKAADHSPDISVRQ